MNINNLMRNIFYKLVAVLSLIFLPLNAYASNLYISPSAETGGVSAITQSSASVTVHITDTGNYLPTEIGVQYGTTNSYGSIASETGTYYSGYTYNSEYGQSANMNGADDLVVDSSSNIYVSDYNNNRVVKFNSNGVYQLEFGTAGSGVDGINSSNAMAIDSSDNIYVNDWPNSRIQVFDSNGTHLRQVGGTSGSGDGELSSQYGFKVDSSGNLYVADWGNNRIEKFDSSGNYVSQFGSSGSGNGEFNLPSDVAFDASGNIYVTDYSNNRVQKFNSAGVYQSQFGSFGSTAGHFSNPYNINIDSHGDIYVTDDNSTQVFSSSGVYKSRIVTGAVGKLKITPSDIMYVAYFSGNVFQKFLKYTGTYTINLSGLSCGTQYYYRVYTTSTAGSDYSDGDSFTTSPCDARTTVLIPSAPAPVVAQPTASPTAVVNGAPQVQPFLKNLEKGMNDEDVKRLQEYLNKHSNPVSLSGLGSAGNETTLFGQATKKALAKFQKSVGLPGSGYFGPKTREYINNHL